MIASLIVVVVVVVTALMGAHGENVLPWELRQPLTRI